MDKFKQHTVFDKIYDLIFKPNVLLIIGGVTLLVFIISMYHRYIYIDDAWFGEQAYWFSKVGYVKTPTIQDFHQWDTHLLVYHKLNIIIGAGMIKIFGWSVTSLRTLSLLYMVLFFIIFYFYHKTNHHVFGYAPFVVPAFFIFCNPLVVLYAFTYRPEVLVMLLGFLSFLFIDRYLSGNRRDSYAALAGLFAGLAFLTHLNAMAFGVAGFLTLIFMKKFRAAFIFGMAGIVTASLYFYDLWQPGHFDHFLYQMTNWTEPQASNYAANSFWDYIFRIIVKLSKEHQRFFWSYKVWGISSLFLLSVIFGFKKLRQTKPHLLLYVLLIVLSLNMLGSRISEKSLIYLFPYFAITISVMICNLANLHRPVLKLIVILAFLLNLFGVGYMFADIFTKNDDYVNQHQEVLAKIPDPEAKILVHYRFIFNELPKRHLVTLKGFEYHEIELGRKMLEREFLERARALDIDYFVVPTEILTNNDSRFPYLRTTGKHSGGLVEVIYEDADYRLLKLNEAPQQENYSYQ
jgi:hypothetical protein